MNPSLRIASSARATTAAAKIGYLEATLAFAAKHPALGAEFLTLLTTAARRLQPPVATANSPPQLTLVSD